MFGELLNEHTRLYDDAFIEVLAARKVRFAESDTMFDYEFGAKIAGIPERAAQVAWQLLRQTEYAVPSGVAHHYLSKDPITSGFNVKASELVAESVEA
jgi:hypothetical protein